MATKPFDFERFRIDLLVACKREKKGMTKTLKEVGVNPQAIYIGKKFITDKTYEKLKKIDLINVDNYIGEFAEEIVPLIPEMKEKLGAPLYYYYKKRYNGIPKSKYEKHFITNQNNNDKK